MNRFFTLLLAASCLTAVGQVTYPYNPDGNNDDIISLNDLLDILSTYGLAFEIQEHICGLPVAYHGVIYNTTLIGSQCWFAENLATSEFRNGEEIPLRSSNSSWTDAANNQLAARCYPTQNAGFENIEYLGFLYNWFAVSDSQNLCPVGWSVPTSSQFGILKARAGGTEYSAMALKDDDWGFNSCGFAGKQGSTRGYSGSYVGETGFWSRSIGSSQITNDYMSKYMRLPPGNVQQVLIEELNNFTGMYVRCIKD